MKMDVVDSQKNYDILSVARKLNEGRTKKQPAQRPSNSGLQKVQNLVFLLLQKITLHNCVALLTFQNTPAYVTLIWKGRCDC